MKIKVQTKELREKSTKDLVKDLKESEKKISELKFQASFKKLKNYKQIQHERKKIARIWTILSEKAIEELSKENNGKQN
ncbi:MAG: ribosomal protein [Candidatus Berkelbacteria bacterium]|nr:ribosomal protein [Candidatus Berkelbacteria bacterium]